MGEAKRRKQLDPNYGKIHHLRNDAHINQQAELVIKELFTHFSVELKTLMIATSFPDNYLEITERIRRWLTLRLSRYTSQDRSCIAQFIFALITNLEDGIITDGYDREHPVSPLIICCFLRVTKNYIEPHHLHNLKQMFQHDFDLLSPIHQAEPLSQSFITEIHRIIP